VPIRQYLELLFLLTCFFMFLCSLHIVRYYVTGELQKAIGLSWERLVLDSVDCALLLVFTLYLQNRYNKRNEKRMVVSLITLIHNCE
jgi:hypothetical protein